MSDPTTERQFEKLWVRANFQQKLLVASRAAYRMMPALVVDGGFSYLQDTKKQLTALRDASIIGILYGTLPYRDASVRKSIRIAVDGVHSAVHFALEQADALAEVAAISSVEAAMATCSAAVVAADADDANENAAFAVAYEVLHAAAAADAATEADAVAANAAYTVARFAESAARASSKPSDERSLQIIELQQLVDPTITLLEIGSAPLVGYLGNTYQGLTYQKRNWHNQFLQALRKVDANDIADLYEKHAFHGFDFNELQMVLFGKVLVPFDERQIDSAPSLPKQLDYPEWWSLFLYRLAISDRQYLPVLSDPDPIRIARMLKSLIATPKADSLLELESSVRKSLAQMLISESHSIDSIQPPPLWLAWLNNVHADSFAKLKEHVAREVYGVAAPTQDA